MTYYIYIIILFIFMWHRMLWCHINMNIRGRADGVSACFIHAGRGSELHRDGRHKLPALIGRTTCQSLTGRAVTADFTAWLTAPGDQSQSPMGFSAPGGQLALRPAAWISASPTFFFFLVPPGEPRRLSAHFLSVFSNFYHINFSVWFVFQSKYCRKNSSHFFFFLV